MSLGVLYDTYKRYKADTEQIVRWLAEKGGYNSGEKAPSHVLPDLAKKVPAECVSRHILRTLDQVIQARKECAAQYKLRNGDQASNDKHEYFIHILEEVRGSLRGSLPKPPPERPARTSTTLQNRFELLEVQEPVEWSDNVIEEGYEDPQKTKVEDGVFASFCFLLDCHRIREFCKSIWTRYGRKEISLTVAALTTNVAFDNIKRLHDELTRRFPDYASYQTLKNILLDEGTPSEDMEFDGHLEPTRLPGHEAYYVLLKFLEGYQRGGFVDRVDEDEVVEQSAQTKSAYIIEKLVQNIPDIIRFVYTTQKQIWPADEFSYALGRLYKGHELTVPLILASEIFVDIHTSLAGSVQRPFQELQESARGTETSLQKLDIYSKALGVNCSSNKTKETLAYLDMFTGTLVRIDLVAGIRRAQPTPAREIPPFNMLKNHPALCGILRFHLDRTLCDSGLRLCCDWECCIAVLHLYHAAKPHMSSRWPDAETFIDMYGEAYLFKGTVPTTPKERFKRVLLVMGLSLPRRTNGPRRIEATDALTLPMKQPILDIMCKRDTIQSVNVESATVLKDIETLLRSAKAGQPSDRKARIMRQWKRHKKLDPLDMLDMLTEGIQQEESQLYFDFISFNRRCLELVRRLRDRLVKAGPEIAWPPESLANQKLSGTLPIIFDVLNRETELSSRYMQAVKQSLEEMIEREGDAETKKIKARCTE